MGHSWFCLRGKFDQTRGQCILNCSINIITDGAGNRLRYVTYMPHILDSQLKWPLVLFLHGSGERGDDIALVSNHGLPKFARDVGSYPFILVAPQCPLEKRWTDYTDTLYELVQNMIGGYSIDPNRLYLTGLSMGGQGTWNLSVNYPELFAAILPVCGRIPPALDFMDKLCKLRDKPTWIFHGAMDEAVPVEDSKKIAAKLKACGNNARLTIYPEGTHFIWDMVYANPLVMDWLLSHVKALVCR